MDKKTIIRTLEQIALHLELLGQNPFKIAAYRKAAATLENDPRSVDEMDDIYKLKGIGKSTGEVIRDLLERGESTTLNELREEVPEGLIRMLDIEGLGGKRIAKLHEALGIDSVEALKEACEEERVSTLKGFGKKTEQNFLRAIAQLEERGGKHPRWQMERDVKRVTDVLDTIKAIERYEVTGSFRRFEEESSDIDVITVTTDPLAVNEQLQAALPIRQLIASGASKLSFTLDFERPVDIDFRFVTSEQFATAIHHFTGSKDHNVRMRQLAKERGEKISEYGVEKDGVVRTFETEEQFFAHFGLPWIPPTLRQNGQEIDRVNELQTLPQVEDMRADFHMHTVWSDGAHSIEEMAEACRKKGYTHAVITDHSHHLKVANGLTPERLLDQVKAIRQVNETMDDFTLFAGTEMDILPDGTLDFEDDVLRELDWVIAAIHTNFNQTEEEIMHRFYAAMTNPYVSCIAHPTGRLLGKRDGYPVDVRQLIDWASEYGKIVELNASPYRLDLMTEALSYAYEKRVPIAINTDAHAIDQLDHMTLGVEYVKKAWIDKEFIVNTWTTERWIDYVKHQRKDV